MEPLRLKFHVAKLNSDVYLTSEKAGLERQQLNFANRPASFVKIMKFPLL